MRNLYILSTWYQYVIGVVAKMIREVFICTCIQKCTHEQTFPFIVLVQYILSMGLKLCYNKWLSRLNSYGCLLTRCDMGAYIHRVLILVYVRILWYVPCVRYEVGVDEGIRSLSCHFGGVCPHLREANHQLLLCFFVAQGKLEVERDDILYPITAYFLRSLGGRER